MQVSVLSIPDNNIRMAHQRIWLEFPTEDVPSCPLIYLLLRVAIVELAASAKSHDGAGRNR